MRSRLILGQGLLLCCLLVNFWGQPTAVWGRTNEVRVKILAFNDFHGHLTKDGLNNKGGAAVLAAYLEEAAKGWEGRTFIVHAGDQVGGSAAASALLQDKPSITFLNLLARQKGRSIIGTLGNHEFDQGRAMLECMVRRNLKGCCSLKYFYPGVQFPYVCANVISQESGQPLLPPFVIREVDGVPIAFVGAVSTETPGKTAKGGIAGIQFQDEAKAINEQVEVLKSKKVRAIVVLIHEGGNGQVPYKGPTDPRNNQLRGKIVDIVNRLDDEVDVVISGHTHKFTNAMLKNQNHQKILVTQAFWHGEAFADIELSLSKSSRDVVTKKAEIKCTDWQSVPVFEDNSPKADFIQKVSDMADQAKDRARDIISRKLRRQVKDTIAVAGKELPKQPNESGESILGNLVADAQRQAGRTNFAMVNIGSIRSASIGRGEVNNQGPITWGELFCVQPFGKKLVKLTLTGQEIIDILKQQWAEAKKTRFLQVSGLTYAYRDSPPHELTVMDCSGASPSQPKPLDLKVRYTVTVSEFLAQGGDNFTAFIGKPSETLDVTDTVALFNYVEFLRQPFEKKIEGRIRNLDRPETSPGGPGARQGLNISSAAISR